jgi:hypothetical protein
LKLDCEVKDKEEGKIKQGKIKGEMASWKGKTRRRKLTYDFIYNFPLKAWAKRERLL